MHRTCAISWCRQPFEITEGDLAFYDKVSPVFGGKKFPIPPPTRCPECRQQRRLAICNEFNLYAGRCDLCEKQMIMQFEPQSGRTVYCRECWHSDRWEPCTYGRVVNFQRPFFEQFKELRDALPAQGLDVQGTLINSEYIHYAGSSKNCYLIMHADFCEDCCYGYGFKKDKSCVDGFYNLHCELCYDCVDCHKCYSVIGSQDCVNCHSSAFLRDCMGCKNCFLCVGLREKEYYFENEQLSKEAYLKRIAAIDLSSYRQYHLCKRRRKDLEVHHSFKEHQGHNLENCSGDHLFNCKNVHESFDCEDVEDGKHCYQLVLAAKDVHDIYQYGSSLQASYECAICGENSFHLLFCFGCHMGSSDLSYCFYMESCKNCFGCAYMQRQHHCILNKQYTKEEYEALVPKIIEHMRRTGEWGEYFPMSLSQFGYNKTTAHLYYPRVKEQVAAMGARWSDYDAPPPKVAKVIPAERLPDSIDDIPDDILNWAIMPEGGDPSTSSEQARRPFRIVKQELAFYRKMRLPIPHFHPDERHRRRMAMRNPRKLWKRNCMKCDKEIETTYAPERPETVYCEECYLKTVY